MATPEATRNKNDASKDARANGIRKTHSLYDTIVYVKVRDSDQKFGIHKALLCHHSAYFKAALNGNFKEAEEGSIILDEDYLEVLDRFNGWLYTRELMKEGETISTVRWPILLEMCVFAEKRSIPKLHNAAIDTIIRKSIADHAWPVHSIVDAWDNTPALSKLRKFCVDVCAQDLDLERVLEHRPDLREILAFDFIADIALALYKRLNTEAEDIDFWKERCRWHIHGPTDLPCGVPT